MRILIEGPKNNNKEKRKEGESKSRPKKKRKKGDASPNETETDEGADETEGTERRRELAAGDNPSTPCFYYLILLAGM